MKVPDLISIITASDPSLRDQSLESACKGATSSELVAACEQLDAFRHQSSNLYEKARALFFLAAIHRYLLPACLASEGGDHGAAAALIPFHGFEQLLGRRFEEASETFRRSQGTDGASDAISSALSTAYQRLAFQTLADQVRRSVRSVRGNQWMFRMGHPEDHPLRIRPDLLQRQMDGSLPILREETPVRMDLTHSAWRSRAQVAMVSSQVMELSMADQFASLHRTSQFSVAH